MAQCDSTFNSDQLTEKTLTLGVNRKIYIDFTSAGELANAYAVDLASEDGSYGVKSVNPSATIFAAGTAVDNPTIGRYEKTITITPGAIYTAAWRVYPTAASDPQYIVTQLGPFAEASDKNIRAVPESKGTYKTGTTAYLFLKITQLDGTPIDPSSMNIAIRDSSGGLDTLDVPEKLSTGYYNYEWNIPAAQDTGKYTIIWSYIIEGVEEFEKHFITVTEDVITTNSIYNEKATILRNALEYRLACAQCIPVYYEQAKPSHDNQTYYFTFPRWNQSSNVRVYRNKKIDMIESGNIDIDCFRGRVIFDRPLTQYDRIFADYNFRWFDDDELHQYLVAGVNTFNSYPPVSGYTIDTLPDSWTNSIVLHAASEALRKLLLCLNFQEPRQVFGGDDMLSQVYGNIDGIKKNYEESYNKLFDLKKFGAYPVIAIVSVPSHTLPGGRCLAYNTLGIYRISNSIISLPLYKIYEISKINKNIKILSHNKSGKLSFEPIYKIWESGKKDVFSLETQLGYSINTSEEHLFYINNTYIPLKDIRIGDTVLCLKNGKLIPDKVVNIYLKDKVETFDLEVPTTQNLIANGIKCHNSRWFRMLYK